jgi:3,4-dihydroxy-9,10-secoandrosta-1,3,5(10)-triene-9,17-dione 4,5-dioxygenase
MPIRSLGYLRLTTPNLSRWESFATDILGMMPAPGPHSESRYFRIDDRPYRLELNAGERKGVAAVGFEVGDDKELADVVDDLERAGVDVDVASDADADDQLVTGLARFTDPGGIRVELFFGPILDHVPVRTPLISRFVTGEMGMGHVVLAVNDLAASSALFRDVLGFHRRNTMRVRETKSDGSTSVTSIHFLGCNPRHHTLGVVGMPFEGQIVHFMLEAADIDDVGRALDRVHDAELPISLTLGRHTNDHMVSFYVTSPDGYSVELGCGGLLVEGTESATTYEITKGSFWGHRRPNRTQP